VHGHGATRAHALNKDKAYLLVLLLLMMLLLLSEGGNLVLLQLLIRMHVYTIQLSACKRTVYDLEPAH
jgi:hypothetical protein